MQGALLTVTATFVQFCLLYVFLEPGIAGIGHSLKVWVGALRHGSVPQVAGPAALGLGLGRVGRGRRGYLVMLVGGRNSGGAPRARLFHRCQPLFIIVCYCL